MYYQIIIGLGCVKTFLAPEIKIGLAGNPPL
jgi:hypothetical protein